MKLIILYGSPAVGKLTVAKVLAKKTGYKLFHNHLVSDLVESVFAFGTADYANLAERFKLMIIKEAAKQNIDLILTLVYGIETLEGKGDERLIKTIVNTVERRGGTSHFIRITCEKEEQVRRLGNNSRKLFKKLTDPDILAQIDDQYQLDSKIISFANALELDTTSLSPQESVQQILAYLESRS